MVGLEKNVTVSGAVPFVTLADGEHAGAPAEFVFKYHGVVVASVLKNETSCRATFPTPLVLG